MKTDAEIEELLRKVDRLISYELGSHRRAFETIAQTIRDQQAEIERLRDIVEDYDPTPWCSGCKAQNKSQCHCGPIAEND